MHIPGTKNSALYIVLNKYLLFSKLVLHCEQYYFYVLIIIMYFKPHLKSVRPIFKPQNRISPITEISAVFNEKEKKQ